MGPLRVVQSYVDSGKSGELKLFSRSDFPKQSWWGCPGLQCCSGLNRCSKANTVWRKKDHCLQHAYPKRGCLPVSELKSAGSLTVVDPVDAGHWKTVLQFTRAGDPQLFYACGGDCGAAACVFATSARSHLGKVKRHLFPLSERKKPSVSAPSAASAAPQDNVASTVAPEVRHAHGVG
jgi:hypothetical protein